MLININLIIVINNAMIPKPYCALGSPGKLNNSVDFWAMFIEIPVQKMWGECRNLHFQ